MSDMLSVTTGQIRYPIADIILVKSDNRLVHALSTHNG